MLKDVPSDIKLWAAVRNDNEAAFTILFDRYWVRLYKTACRYVDQELSKEIVHDVFLNIWNRRHELDIQSFENFLLTSVRYQIYNYKRLAKLQLVSMPDYRTLDGGTNSNEGIRRIEAEELHQEISGHLEQLPKRCREIFQMSREHDLSNQEIANSLGISKRTVENQITKALKHLRDQMGLSFLKSS